MIKNDADFRTATLATITHRAPARHAKASSIAALGVGFLLRLHKLEAPFHLSKQADEFPALLRRQARHDALLFPQQSRDQLLIERLALVSHAQRESAAVVDIRDALDQSPLHQRHDGAADRRFMRA